MALYSKLRHDLPFLNLSDGQFEDVCRDYLRMKYPGAALQTMPSRGHRQGGLDLLVLVSDGDRKLCIGYECKNVARFMPSDLNSTVQRLLNGEWPQHLNRFVLILGGEAPVETRQNIVGYVRSFAVRGLDFEFVDRKAFTDELVQFPEIIQERFGDHDLYYALTDRQLANFNRQQQEKKEKEKKQQEAKPKAERTDQGGVSQGDWEILRPDIGAEAGNFRRYTGKFISIDAHLPSGPESLNGLDMKSSCLISFRNPALKQIQLSLGHSQVLMSLFRGAESPVTAGMRGFQFGKWDVKQSSGHVLLGNTSFSLSWDEAADFARQIDRYFRDYVQAAGAIERKLGIDQFDALQSYPQYVPLVRITAQLWRSVLNFAFENDYGSSSGEWAVFSTGAAVIKIYVDKTTAELDRGYHAFFYPDAAPYFVSPSRESEVVVKWEPPMNYLIGSWEKGDIGPRFYWDAVFAHDWLLYKLIPRVLSETVDTPLAKKNGGRDLLDELCKKGAISSYKQPLLPQASETTTAQSLAVLFTELQAFYNVARDRGLYFDQTAHKSLYQALQLLFHRFSVEKDFSYFNGCLGVIGASSPGDFHSKLDLYTAGINGPITNTFVVDLAMRCLHVATRDFAVDFSLIEIQALARLVEPYTQAYRHQLLLDRQEARFTRYE